MTSFVVCGSYEGGLHGWSCEAPGDDTNDDESLAEEDEELFDGDVSLSLKFRDQCPIVTRPLQRAELSLETRT